MGENEITLELLGKPVTVPEGMTLIQALWASGIQTIHGVGCLGGVCGACVVSFRQPNDHAPRSGLACQTVVQEGMKVTFLPSDASPKAVYAIPDHSPGTDDLLAAYPQTRRCTRCQACNTVCPQGIAVMSGIRSAIQGAFAQVADTFTDCIMCGLCAAVCEVQIPPHRVGLWARRMHAAFYPAVPQQLMDRLGEMRDGRYEALWQRVLSMDDEELQSTPL